MKYWEQTDKRINPISWQGCYFISLANLAQMVLDRELTAREIVFSFAKNTLEGDVDSESTILDPEGVMQDFGVDCEFLGHKPPEYVCGFHEYEILCYKNKVTGFTHFVLGNGSGKVLVDPIKNSITVRDGYLHSKRIYRIPRREKE